MLRVVVVARDQFWNDAVTLLIAQQADLEVSATVTAPDLDEVISLVQIHPCDLVIVQHDLGMLSGLDLVSELAGRLPDLPIIIGGVPEREAILTSYFEYGVIGYVLEEAPLDQLIAVIRAAGRGESVIPPPVAAALLDRLTELSQVLGNAAPAIATVPTLTPREQEILQLIAAGHSNQQISDTLFIEVGTVKNHVHRILRKLDVDDRQQAARVLMHTEGNNTPGGVGT